MNIRKIILLIFSLIFALVLAYLVYSLLNTVSEENVVVDIEYVDVLIANKDIEEASVINAKDLRFIKLPKDLNMNEYFTDKDMLAGKYAAEKIYSGEYIHSSRVIDEYSDKLSRDIEYDKRAVAIYTDKFSAVADLLKPGDRVDLYLFIPEKKNGDEIIHPDVSKLLIQNIKVLSIDQDTVGTTVPREETPDRYAITLEAYYKDVEQIVLAESIGYLKIALRPMGDDTIYITYGSVWEELIADENLNIRDLEAEYPTINDVNQLNKEIISKPNTSKNNSTSKDEVSTEDKSFIDVNVDMEKTNSDIKISLDEEDVYIVKSGDTLMKIAKQVYGDASKYTLIIKANNISNPSHIVTGRKLKIPKIEE